MAGAFHGEGEPETVINVGISGPGVVTRRAVPDGRCGPGRIVRDHQAHRLQDHPHGRAGRPGDGHEARRRVRHRRPVAGAHAGRGRFRRQHPRGHGPGAVRHPRHDGRAGAADRRRQEGRRHGHIVHGRPLGRLHPGERGRGHGRSASRPAPSASTSWKR